MILVGNINIEGLNLIKNQATSTNQSTGFDEIFNEFLKLLFENKDISTDGSTNNNSFIFPFVSLQNFLLQDIKNFQEISQTIEFSPALKAVFSNLLKEKQIDIKELSNLFQNLKTQNNKYDIQNFFENFDPKNFLNTENSKEIVNILNSQQTKNDQATELFKLNINPDNSNQNKSLFLNIVNESYSENQDIKSKFFNTDKVEKILNNDKLSSQLNIFNNVQSRNNEINDIQQKIDLPFTQLKEVSNIVFKALSSSQKTIIVQLEPPELGKILIKLSMDNAGVRADMKVDYPQVKEALTGLIPEIKSNLQSSGVKVSDFLLDLTKEHRGYSDSYNGQGQKRYRGNEKFIEYFA